MKKKATHKRIKQTGKTLSKRRAFLKQLFFFLFIAGFMWTLAGFQIGRHILRSQFVPCANSISCINDLTGNYEPQATQGVFMGRVVSPPTFAEAVSQPTVLGENTGEKHIYVDLSSQHLYAFQGNTLVYNFLVSTGKWNKTPTGDFKIWIKLRYTRMKGGNPAIGTYYDLPNVPYTMFFYNSDYAKSEGYSIHGAYWHNNFGHPMSHGCVNMRIADAEAMYNWANPPTQGSTTYASNDNPGTTVTIYGIAPVE